eukprot:s39_g7.t1
MGKSRAGRWGLAGLDACQTLCLDDNEVGTLDWLPPLQELEELSIERCGLLSLQGELQKLDAGGNQLTDAPAPLEKSVFKGSF